MIRGIAILLMSALPAISAECIELPTRITFQTGEILEVVYRNSEVVRYQYPIQTSDGVITGESMAAVGIFTMRTKRAKDIFTFEWITSLPHLSEVVPGATFSRRAVVTSPDGKTRPLRMEVEVLEEEQFILGSCSYPVLHVLVSIFGKDNTPTKVEKWLHLPSLISFRSVVTEGEIQTENLVVALE